MTLLPISCVIIARSFTSTYRYFCFKLPVVFLDAARVLGSVNCCFSPNMESILSNIFPHHSHPFPSGTPSMHMLEYSILSHKSPRLCSFFFNLFSLWFRLENFYSSVFRILTLPPDIFSLSLSPFIELFISMIVVCNSGISILPKPLAGSKQAPPPTGTPSLPAKSTPVDGMVPSHPHLQ